MKKPLILVTNDDGYRAGGIKALAESMHGLGEIIVVAPYKPNSGMSGAVTVMNPLRIFDLQETKADIDANKVYVCNGTPVDCIKLAVQELTDNRKPDLIISGINHGANSAVSVLYSGTMGAAIEGCIKGIPSIGFSILDHGMDADFNEAKKICRGIATKVLKEGLPDGTCLNVNIPVTKDIKGIRIARQAKGLWVNEYYKSTDGRGKPVYWLTGNFENHEDDENDSDEFFLAENYATVVPVKIDMTDYAYLKNMEDWIKDF